MLSAVIGSFVLLVLLSRRLLLMAAAIGLNAAGFCVIYPPIPAYMFGGYILIAAMMAVVIDSVVSRAAAGAGWWKLWQPGQGDTCLRLDHRA